MQLEGIDGIWMCGTCRSGKCGDDVWDGQWDRSEKDGRNAEMVIGRKREEGGRLTGNNCAERDSEVSVLSELVVEDVCEEIVLKNSELVVELSRFASEVSNLPDESCFLARAPERGKSGTELDTRVGTDAWITGGHGLSRTQSAAY